MLSCSTKDVLIHKHLRSVIKHTFMNKLPYVNRKHYKNLVFLLLQYHLIITILTFKFANLTYNVHHAYLMYAINAKK